MAWPDQDLDVASVLVPVDAINTAGVLTSITSNGVALAEDTNPAWSSGTTYNTLGQRVYSATTHRVYENLKTDSSNVNKDPTVLANQATAAGVGTYWLDVGPTNKYAAFDGLVNTQLSAASPVVIVMKPGAFNGFALLGVDADTLTVTVKDATGGNVIWSQPSLPMEGSMPGDYYEYFYDRFKPLTRYTATGIDPYGASEITITLTKATGNVKLGMLAIGDMRPLGIPQRDATVDPVDYSRIKTDGYGGLQVKKGPTATNMRITAKMEIEDANTIKDTIDQVMGIPCLVVGSKAKLYEWMTTFGLVTASITPQDYPYVTMTVNVRGTI